MLCLHLADLLSYRRNNPYQHIQKNHLPPSIMTTYTIVLLIVLITILTYVALDCGLILIP